VLSQPVHEAQSAAYTEDIPQKRHILAIFGAKFAAIRLFRALFAVQGLPSVGTAQKQKRRNGKTHSANLSRHGVLRKTQC
jgi:hypothetical protein